MAKLHLLRSKPDAVTDKLMAELSNDGEDVYVRLYAQDLDWEDVVDSIFNHDSVVCWW